MRTGISNTLGLARPRNFPPSQAHRLYQLYQLCLLDIASPCLVPKHLKSSGWHFLLLQHPLFSSQKARSVGTVAVVSCAPQHCLGQEVQVVFHGRDHGIAEYEQCPSVSTLSLRATTQHSTGSLHC